MTELIDENELYDLAEIFKVFGDSTRIRILFALFDEEKSVNEIAKQLNMTDSAVSHQLALLKLKNLVTKRRNGLHSMYKLSDEHVEKVLAIALEHALED